jgi:drug/metabolite transporter (DMT)-like permease
MKRVHFILGFVALLAFDTVGQVGFKLTGNNVMPIEPNLDFLQRLLTEPWVLATMMAYLGSFLIYMTLIKDAPAGLLFAASHLEIVTVTALSVMIFGDRLSFIQGIGCAVIIAGLLLLAPSKAKLDKEKLDPVRIACDRASRAELG